MVGASKTKTRKTGNVFPFVTFFGVFLSFVEIIFHLVSFKNPSAWETRTLLLLECCIYQPKNAKGCWQNQKFIYIYSISLYTWWWIYNYRSAVIFCQLIEDIFLLAICFYNCQPNYSIEYPAEFCLFFFSSLICCSFMLINLCVSCLQIWSSSSLLWPECLRNCTIYMLKPNPQGGLILGGGVIGRCLG